ncbi:MAG: bpX6 domain-containing protein, partial [Cellvibrio sp.]
MKMQINYPKGRIFAHGYFFKDDSLSQSTTVERIISSWKSNTKAFKHPEGILLLWEEGVSILIDECIAIPIMREKNLYANTLLNQKQINEFWGHGESLHLVLEGVLHISLIGKLEKFDPSIWLEISSYPLEPLTTLGFVPSAKNNSVGEPKKIRDLLGAESLRESDAQIDAVRSLSHGGAINRADRKPKRWVSLAMAAFKGTFSKTSKQNSGETNSYGVTKPKKQSVLSRLRDSLQNQLMASKLGQLVGQRQAQYIQEMMEKFDNVDLTDALRHAIPLSNIQDAMNSTRSAIGRPGVRNQLSISPASASGARGSLNVDDQIMQHMRQLYERAFSRLDKDNSFEEAAFVLAELLLDIDRAVKYLEEHGQLILAAKLAEVQR